MKIRAPWLICVAAFLGAAVLRVWLGSVRTRSRSADGRPHPADPRRERYIYAFWHESLLAPAKMRTPAKVLVSQSADGELIAQVCGYFGIGAIRGSATRGGAGALLEMLRDDQPAHLAITPDGPRGPRRRFKPGAVFVASHSGLAIVPVGIGFTRAWRFASWDRFALPMPFSTATGVLGAPIAVPPQLDGETLEQYRCQIERELLACTEAAQAWADELAGRRRASSDPTLPGMTPPSPDTESSSDGPHRTGRDAA